jgi:4-amino-4-deoxy-L-arabinose transferase-like glycosyltransferase
VLLVTLSGWLVYLLAKRFAGPGTAVLAAAVFSFHWLALVYGGTVYPRTVATTCILLAALLVTGEGGELARSLGAGALVALAFADRYSEAIFLAPLLVWLLRPGRRVGIRLSGAAGLILGFGMGALLTVGLADLFFWGRPFASLLAFARFTLLERRSSSLVHDQPALWYLDRIIVWLPPTLLPFLVRLRRRAGLLLPWLGFALPVLLLSLVHHKELRYLAGVLPFLAILAAVGAEALWRAGWRRWTAGLLATSLVLSLNTARSVLGHSSVAAVAAARALHAGPPVAAVALSQPWAYGDHLFFDNGVELCGLSTPPTEAEIRRVAARAAVVGLYAEDLARSPELERWLGEAGHVRAAEVSAWQSKPVVLFRRPAGGLSR